MVVTGLVALIVLLVVVGTFVTQWAWNILMPAIFHLPPIDLLQAFALNVLIMTVRGVTSSANKKD